jgi:CubicO group peptidase (beta-lactamase class C family)
VCLLIAPPPGPVAGEVPVADPEAVGLSAEVLGEVKPALEAMVEEGKVAGGVALVARRGAIAMIEPFGLRDIASGAPMTEDSIFAIASMTKPITCVAVMSLVEAGSIGLDDPIGEHLPALRDLLVLSPDDRRRSDDGSFPTVPADRPVTVRDLLRHTSGISYGGFLSLDRRLGALYDEADVMARDMETVAEQVERLGTVPLAHQPGEQWTYGLSHDVLGRLVEVASGLPLDRFLDDHIFTPLGMADTGFLVPEADRDRVATIYRARPGAEPTLEPLPREFGSGTFFAGGAGLFSTARDYARFAQMLLNGGELDGARILRPETVALMTTNQIGELNAFGLNSKYGLGLGLQFGRPGPDGERPLRRYSWGGIFSTDFWVAPEEELVAVLMTQLLPTNASGAEGVFRSIVERATLD